MIVFSVGIRAIDLLLAAGVVSCKAEAERYILSGRLKVNGVPCTPDTIFCKDGYLTICTGMKNKRILFRKRG